MKIVITEGGTINNIGSAALIENAIKIAKDSFKNCEITVLSQQPLILKKFVDSDVNTDADLFIVPWISKKKSLIWLMETILWLMYYYFVRLVTRHPEKYIFGQKKNTLKIIQDADFVFCIGAERINDIYYKTAYMSLEALSIFQGLGKRLIHLSLTIGPIFNRSTIHKTKKVLNNSYAIFVRDNKSFELLQDLKIEKPIICNSYDIAILQQQGNLNEIQNLLIKKGININKPIIGVSVLYWRFRHVKGLVRQSGYNESIAETLDYIIQKYDYQILFTPTVVTNEINDDVYISHCIYELMKEKKNTYFIDELLTPKQLSTIFSITRFSIVTRMHAAILCSGAGAKPIIAINYLYKLREFMKRIDFENYSIDIDETNCKDLISIIEEMEINYNTNINKLKNRMNEMKSELLFDLKEIPI